MPVQDSATNNQYIFTQTREQRVQKAEFMILQLTCENWAKVRSASMGTWPKSSWTQSLRRKNTSEVYL